jgi:hypothetical protein
MLRTEEHGYWRLVQAVWLHLNRSWDDGTDEFLRRFQTVRPEAGHLYAAHWCQSEVCNGGLLQFFSNTTGILAPEALDAFRTIGLDAWETILAEAMRFFGALYPRKREERLQRLAGSGGRKRREQSLFEALDERFFDWLSAGPNRWQAAADKYASKFES